MTRALVTLPMIRRITALHRAGLSHAAIAAVVNLDQGSAITSEQVRYHIRVYGAPNVRQARCQLARGGSRMGSAVEPVA